MIPRTLINRPSWVVWKTVVRNGKPTKVPFDPKAAARRGERCAKSNDPATWADLWTAERAMVAGTFDGLGFVFGPDGGLFGVDLDACLSPGGELAGWAEDILEQFTTYAEVSPSGTGVKIFGRGTFEGRGPKKTMPGEPIGDKHPGIEVYCRGRFFALTGRRWPGTPAEVRNCQLALTGLVTTLRPATVARAVLPLRRPTGGATPALERARRYLAKTPAAVSGQRGHDVTFRAACVLVRDIGVSHEDAYGLLAEWNQGCQPPWSEAELRRKVQEAAKAPAPVAV